MKRSHPQAHVLITRSFHFHGNGRIRDFGLMTITDVGRVTAKPDSAPARSAGPEGSSAAVPQAWTARTARAQPRQSARQELTLLLRTRRWKFLTDGG